MRKSVTRLVKTNQQLNLLSTNSLIKKFFLKKHIHRYSATTQPYQKLRSSKVNSVCFLQGTYKKTLKVYGFNRHLIRNISLKSSFRQLKSSG